MGQGRLGPFLVIGGDGCGGVVTAALDDVESPDVEAGAREFAGKVGQGSGLVRQLDEHSFVRDCLEAGLVEDGKGVVRPVGGDDHHAVLSLVLGRDAVEVHAALGQGGRQSGQWRRCGFRP